MTRGRNYKNDTYPADFNWVKIDGAKITVLVLCGIGETENWIRTKYNPVPPDPRNYALDRVQTIMSAFIPEAEQLKINLVGIMTYSQYSEAEMLTAHKFAKQEFGTEYFSILPHSQGVF